MRGSPRAPRAPKTSTSSTPRACAGRSTWLRCRPRRPPLWRPRWRADLRHPTATAQHVTYVAAETVVC